MNEHEELLRLLNEPGVRLLLSNYTLIEYDAPVWIVRNRPFGVKKIRTLYSGNSLLEAIAAAREVES